MINHIRTLLLNRDGNQSHGYDCPGEEFVPSMFSAKAVPSFLANALRTLFGFAPDRLFLNYRMFQIMTLLHSTELVEFVTAPDPRITYWPPRPRLFTNVFGTTIVGLGDTVESRLCVYGVQAAAEDAGITEFQWSVGVTTPTSLRVTTYGRPSTTSVLSYTTTDGLTSELTLPNSSLRFRITQPTTADTWLVTVRAKPARDFGVVLQNAMQLADLDRLFSTANDTIAKLAPVWHDHELFPYKYSAVLLAIAHYLDDVVAPRANQT